MLEDVATDAELNQLELERVGLEFDYVRVESRDDFLRELSVFSPDIILADYALPQFNGIAALLLAQTYAPEVPFIFVTGSINEETAVDCIKSGASDYIIKEHLVRLGPAIESALEKQQMKKEKGQFELELRFRTEFEKLIIDTAKNFINIPAGDIDIQVNKLLRAIGEFAGGDRCYLLFISKENPDKFISGYEWCSSGVDSRVNKMLATPLSAFPWMLERFKNQEPIYIPKVSALSSESQLEKLFLESEGIQSLIIVPLVQEGAPVGLLGFDAVRSTKDWSEDIISLLRMVAEIVSNIIAKKLADEKLSVNQRRISQVNECFLSFGSNTNENVQRLVELCGAVLDGGCALYSRLQGGKLYPQAQWKFSADFCPVDDKSGLPCGEMIKINTEEVFVVQNLLDSNYAKINTGIKRCQFKTYVGKVVRFGGKTIGVLCVFYQEDSFPDDLDKKLLSLIASALGIEEERRQVVSELIKSEAKYRELVESVNSIILRMDLDGNVTFINEHAQEFFGYSSEEILGKNILGTIVPENESTGRDLREMIKNLALHPELYINNENENILRNGKRVWISWSNKVIYNKEGRVSELFCVGNDITELRKTRETIQEQVNFLQHLMDNIPSPVYYKSVEGQYLGCNLAYEKLIGKGRDKILNKSAQDIFSRELADKLIEMDKKLLENPGTQVFEYSLASSDGLVHNVIFNKATFFNHLGKLSGLIGVITDISDLKKAYSRLKETQAQLIQAEKMQVVGTLAGGVAHEVKNPLGIILQGVNYLEEDVSPSQEKQREVLAMIKEAVLRADRVIRGMLSFSRQASVEFKAIDINQSIQASLDLLLKQLTLKGVKIIKELNAEMTQVRADEQMLEQVFVNIMLNAVQAMPKGGILSIRTSNKQSGELKDGVGKVAKECFGPGDLVLVCEIEDTGTGIPEDKVGKVFDPFFTTKPPGQGVGIGLSIVQTIIDSHNGLINIESHEGKGTKIVISLPVFKG